MLHYETRYKSNPQDGVALRHAINVTSKDSVALRNATKVTPLNGVVLRHAIKVTPRDSVERNKLTQVCTMLAMSNAA